MLYPKVTALLIFCLSQQHWKEYGSVQKFSFSKAVLSAFHINTTENSQIQGKVFTEEKIYFSPIFSPAYLNDCICNFNVSGRDLYNALKHSILRGKII